VKDEVSAEYIRTQRAEPRDEAAFKITE